MLGIGLACTSLLWVGEPPSPNPFPDAPNDDVVIGHLPTEREIAKVNRRWRGVGIGYSNGLQGMSYSQHLRVDIPLGRRVGQFFGLRVRGGVVHGSMLASEYDPVINSGVQLFGRGPVMLGMVRVYGGGGPFIGVRPAPTADGRT